MNEEIARKVDSLAERVAAQEEKDEYRFSRICQTTQRIEAVVAEAIPDLKDELGEHVERIAKVEVHVEHLVAGQGRIETQLDKLLERRDRESSGGGSGSGGARRFSLFGAVSLAGIGAILGPVLAFWKK